MGSNYSLQHAPGVKVGNDAVPEFSAQTLPAGSAPSNNTHQIAPIPGDDQNLDVYSDVRTRAEESIPGVTSADVTRGVGRPLYGQTSNELRRAHRKARYGLVGVGADPRDPVRERALDKDYPTSKTGGNGISGPDITGAEDRLPESAEAVAAERD